MRKAMEEAYAHTGMSVFMGATTTSIAFYTIAFSDFAGVAELGLIAGTGVLLCLLANLTVLPSLFVIRDNRHAIAGRLQMQGASFGNPPTTQPRCSLHARPLSCWRRPRQPSGPRARCASVSFDYNLLNMQNPEMESVRGVRVLSRPGARA